MPKEQGGGETKASAVTWGAGLRVLPTLVMSLFFPNTPNTKPYVRGFPNTVSKATSRPDHSLN